MKLLIYITGGLAVVGLGIAMLLTHKAPEEPQREIVPVVKKSAPSRDIVEFGSAQRTILTPADAFAEGSKASYRERSRALAGAEGSSDIDDQLKDFVLNSEVPEGMNQSQTLALKNEVLNHLGRAKLDGYADFLAALARDESQLPLLREYALQHLALQEGAVVGEVLWEGLNSTEEEMVAQSLVMLKRQARDTAELGSTNMSQEAKSTLAERALALARDPSSGAAIRISAIHACGELNIVEILPLAQEIIKDSTQEYPIRLASVAAVGSLQTPEARELLRSLADQSHLGGLSRAAQSALDKESL